MKPSAASLITPIVGLSLLARPVVAQDLTDVAEIVQRANLASYYAGNDGRARVRMTITDARGRNRIRQFTILRAIRATGAIRITPCSSAGRRMCATRSFW